MPGREHGRESELERAKPKARETESAAGRRAADIGNGAGRGMESRDIENRHSETLT